MKQTAVFLKLEMVSIYKMGKGSINSALESTTLFSLLPNLPEHILKYHYAKAVLRP